jgi:hypothetical protein
MIGAESVFPFGNNTLATKTPPPTPVFPSLQTAVEAFSSLHAASSTSLPETV